MASQALVIVQGVVRSARDLSSIRDGKRQTFGVAVELLTEVPIPNGAGGFLEVTLFIRDGELLPSHTDGELVTWVVAVEANVYRNSAQIRAQFVSELSFIGDAADSPDAARSAQPTPTGSPADATDARELAAASGKRAQS